VKKVTRPTIVLIGIVLFIWVVWLSVARLEGKAPVLDFDVPLTTISASQELSFVVSDEGNGLRRIWVGLLKDGKDVVLLEKHFPSGNLFRGGSVHRETIDLLIEPRKLGITDGEATFRLVVRDFSWRRWRNGNRTYIEKTVSIDTRPPAVDVLSSMHNISQGGAGLVVYRLSEESPGSGVHVGDHFYPGYSGNFRDKSIFMTFFALNYDQGSQTEMYIEALDVAGNTTRAGFRHHIRKGEFEKDVIDITDNFLGWKMPEFAIEAPAGAAAPMVEKFLRINRELREESLETFDDLARTTDPVLYWEGGFLRLPRSSRKAGFADHRDYRYNGRSIDRQVHQGIDLASVSHSPVPAANEGKVVFAGTIGIYGKTVVIDHGFGLLSTYSHLSGIVAEKGQMVSRGDTIGRTGTTGLAGGDHLHFGMLIHDTFVNPVEWWDAAWIRNNITLKIDAVRAMQP